jgi:hypothetical protein
MRILDENWKVLTSFFPTGWQQMAQARCVRAIAWAPDVLRKLTLNVVRGYFCGRRLCALS